MKDKTRLIALSDSPEMDGELVIFETNAPSKRLKELEKESCALFLRKKLMMKFQIGLIR